MTTANYQSDGDALDGWRDDVLTGSPPVMFPIGSSDLARTEIGRGFTSEPKNDNATAENGTGEQGDTLADLAAAVASLSPADRARLAALLTGDGHPTRLLDPARAPARRRWQDAAADQAGLLAPLAPR